MGCLALALFFLFKVLSTASTTHTKKILTPSPRPPLSLLLLFPSHLSPCLVLPQVTAERAVQNAGGNWQGAANPTYLKQPGDQIWFAAGMLLVGGALTRIGLGYWNMMHGTGKNE